MSAPVRCQSCKRADACLILEERKRRTITAIALCRACAAHPAYAPVTSHVPDWLADAWLTDNRNGMGR